MSFNYLLNEDQLANVEIAVTYRVYHRRTLPLSRQSDSGSQKRSPPSFFGTSTAEEDQAFDEGLKNSIRQHVLYWPRYFLLLT